MTSEDWTSASNPNVLLEALGDQANTRKVRLVACACFARAARLLEHPLVKPDPKGDAQHLEAWVSETLRVCTNHADGNSTDTDFDGPLNTSILAVNLTARCIEASKAGEIHHLIALAMSSLYWTVSSGSPPGSSRNWAPSSAGVLGAWAVLQRDSEEEGLDRDEVRRSAEEAEEQAQAELVREIFGNPFAPVSVEPDWRTLLVVTMARLIYEENDFASLPILADALEDAGCTDPVLLDHCRASVDHVRGCWALDLLAGDDFRPKAIPKPDPSPRLSRERTEQLLRAGRQLLELADPPGVPVDDGRYPLGVVRRAEMGPVDLVRKGTSRNQARARRNVFLAIGGMFAALGLVSVMEIGVVGLVLVGGVVLCFALLAIEEHGAAKDSNGSEKEIIRGVIEERRTETGLLKPRFVFRISGVEVAVPPDIFDRFHEGDTVRAHRTSDTGKFLFLEATPRPGETEETKEVDHES